MILLRRNFHKILAEILYWMFKNVEGENTYLLKNKNLTDKNFLHVWMYNLFQVFGGHKKVV